MCFQCLLGCFIKLKSAKILPSKSFDFFLLEPSCGRSFEIYKEHFEKYKGKNQETEYFSCRPYKHFCRISKMVVCIPEVLTLLLTPILTYIHMGYDRATYMSYMSVMSFMTYKCIWHLSFGMYIYFNMGVKSSVWTSGMKQPSRYTTTFFFKAKN